MRRTSAKRVLLTGGFGFVGSALCRELIRRGHSLYVIDDLSRGSYENVAELELVHFRTDVRDRDGVHETFDEVQPHIVIHLAAMHFIPDCNRDPIACMDINVVGTENVLQACCHDSVQRVVLASSMAVYPINDSANLESHLVDPSDVYGQSKLTNEMQARRFQGQKRVPTVAVRLSNVYGPRETNAHVLPAIMEQLAERKTEIKLGNIEPKRDFVYVTDVARGFADLALKHLSNDFYVVNLGSGKEYSIKEVLAKLSGVLEKQITPLRDPSRYRDVERMHLLADIKRIQELVEWAPEIELRTGLRSLCRWYGLI